MKARMTVLLGIALIGIGLAGWQVAWVSPAMANPEVAAVSAAVVVHAAAGDESQYSYVGSKKCKKCHKGQYESWEKTKKFHTTDILKPGEAAESKTKYGLDAAKDYSKDEGCLKCHATGYGAEGGYAVPDPADEKAVKKAKKRAGVGCESCHGPGSGYTKLHKEIKKSKRTYKVEEMYSAGMTKVEEATCTACHNDKSPTMDPSKPFDFEKQKVEGSHETFPLKQREG